METENSCDCGCNCDCDLSKLDLDMTIRQALEKCGIAPEAAQKCLKECGKSCCKK